MSSATRAHAPIFLALAFVFLAVIVFVPYWDRFPHVRVHARVCKLLYRIDRDQTRCNQELHRFCTWPELARDSRVPSALENGMPVEGYIFTLDVAGNHYSLLAAPENDSPTLHRSFFIDQTRILRHSWSTNAGPQSEPVEWGPYPAPAPN